jgi:acetamidase/formamidase
MTTVQVTGEHNRWWDENPVEAVVEDGDTITFDATEASGGQFESYRNGDPFPPLDPDGIYPLLGPVEVAGAEVGDVVELEVLDYRLGASGWTAVLAGKGLLPEDFPDPHLHHWDLADGFADFLGAASIPLRPFLGVMGTSPVAPEPTNPGPPGAFGGNVDCRDLIVGTRLFLPVLVPGARLMVGDPHAAQGDGEVCTSAIEASLSGELRVRVHRGRTLAAPQFQTAGPLRAGLEDQGYYATMGVGPDLHRAAQDAVRSMIDHMGTEYGIDPVDAYVLSSVAVDLKITEIVDAPNWVVTAYLPTAMMRG